MKSIVYNNINDENNTFKLNVGKLTLYFSSEFNLNRFKDNYEYYIKEENFKIENKYHVKIIAQYYFLIAFYKKIEKRGFRIENTETGAKVNENLIFYIEL